MLQTMTQMSTQANQKYSEYFNKNPLKYQRMLLLASISEEDTPDTLNERAMGFFQNSSSFHSHTILF